MGKLTYSMNVSLDGYVESVAGSLDWANVDEELHAWFNEEARSAAAFVYGRRLYEVMASYWPTAEADANASRVEVDFARVWVPMPKVVFSRTLETVDWNSRLVSGDVGEELTRLRSEFDGELQIGGPTLAAEFIRRGLVDEYRLIVHPVILGGGKPYFPSLEEPLRLRAMDTIRFASGAVCLRYAAER